MLRVLSLGAGVQSSTVLLMACAGELDPVDIAIFADTGWEPAAVYEHLDRLVPVAEEAGIEIRRVSRGNIRDDHVEPDGEHLFVRKPNPGNEQWLGKQRSTIPFFVQDGDGSRGKLNRLCTQTYKIEPLEHEIRNLLGLKHRERWPLVPSVEQIFGISWDESTRMRDSARPAIVNSYPLIDRRMTRADCHAWLAAHGWTAPRSACIGCPFHNNAEWRNIRDNAPDEWTEVVKFDRTFRVRQEAGLLALRNTPYLHSQCVPLDEADIDEPDNGQLSLFDEECQGMCGL